MEQLIEAFQIFLKYSDAKYPTHCEHDELRVFVDPKDVSKEDLYRLEVLGFDPETDDEDEWQDNFISFRFGSC